MKITEFGYVIIGTTDVEKWRAYGTDVLGMMAVDGPDGALYLKMDERDFRFVVKNTGKDQLYASGWGVDTEADFNALKNSVEKAKVKVTLGTTDEVKMRKVQNFFSFSDPSGLRHEVFWGPISSFSKFVSPTGTRFVTTNLGFGHAVLPTSNLKETVEFWTGVMNFGVSDILHLTMDPSAPPISINFLHCFNGRQHSLAFAELGDPAGCNHLMVEVDSIDEVGRALDRVDQHKVPISMTLGRHVNDDMVSFYMVTPSGFQMEFGTGGLVKDWTTHQVFETTRGSHWGHKFILGMPPE